MNEPFPVVPPPELVRQWRAAASNVPATLSTNSGSRRDYIDFIAACAAQWGADTELEACCLWLNGGSKIDYDTAALLRAARRPKPPSLKEQALASLDELESPGRCDEPGYESICNTIRRALESLND